MPPTPSESSSAVTSSPTDRSDVTTSRGLWIGTLVLFGTASLWSLNGPLIKLLHASGVTSGLTIAFYRSFIGGLVLLPFAIRRLETLREAAVPWRIGSVLAFTLMTVTFVVATVETTAANAIILQYSAPIWVFLLAPLLLGERMRWTDGLALVVSMLGVLVIFLGNPVTDRFGLSIALLSGVGYGLLLITLRGLRRVHPLLVVCINCLGSALLIAPAVILWGSFRLVGVQIVLMLALGIVQFAIPYVMYSWAARHVEAHRASLIVLVETILNPLWTYLIVGEAVSKATLRGGPLILIGVVGWMLLSSLRSSRKAPDPSVPPGG